MELNLNTKQTIRISICLHQDGHLAIRKRSKNTSVKVLDFWSQLNASSQVW